MIYEAILYQGDDHWFKHTKKSRTRTNNPQLLPQMSINQPQSVCVFWMFRFVLTCLIYLSFSLINTKRLAGWFVLDGRFDWQHWAQFKTPTVQINVRAIPLHRCWFHIFSCCCFRYWLSLRLASQQQRVSQLEIPPLPVFLACLTEAFSDRHLAYCLYYPSSCSHSQMAGGIARSHFSVYWKAAGFIFWLMSNEMAFSHYRMKILISVMLSEKKGTFIMLLVGSIIS